MYSWKGFLLCLGCLFPQKLVNAVQFHFKNLLVFYPEQSESYPKSCCLCVYLEVYSLLLAEVESSRSYAEVFELSIWSGALCRMRHRLLLIPPYVQRPFVEHAVPSPVFIFDISVKTQVTTVVWPCIRELFYSVDQYLSSCACGYPCIVSDFRRNALKFFPFNIVLTRGLLYITFIIYYFLYNLRYLLCFIMSILF